MTFLAHTLNSKLKNGITYYKSLIFPHVWPICGLHNLNQDRRFSTACEVCGLSRSLACVQGDGLQTDALIKDMTSHAHTL